MTEKSQDKPDDPTFDSRLERLEGIVAALEDGDLGLEAALDRYKEGVGLLKACREQLGQYRKQVEELELGAEGELSPYAGDPDVGA